MNFNNEKDKSFHIMRKTGNILTAVGNLDTKEEYDYIGVLYPEGNMGTESQFLFYHKDIERVVFRGYEDKSRTEFIQKLGEFYEGESWNKENNK